MKTPFAQNAARTRKIACWVLMTAASGALLSVSVRAEDNTAASHAFRPAVERNVADNAQGSRAPSADTSTSATLAFRAASEQRVGSTATFKAPSESAGAAALAFRPPVGAKSNQDNHVASPAELASD